MQTTNPKSSMHRMVCLHFSVILKYLSNGLVFNICWLSCTHCYLEPLKDSLFLHKDFFLDELSDLVCVGD